MPQEPLAEAHFLFLQGIVDGPTFDLIRKGLRVAPSANGRVLFVGFASSDVPLGTRFGFLFSGNRADDTVSTAAVVTAATQQWGKPFDEIPSGWKTICVIEFPLGVPKLIDLLPVVSAWGQSDRAVFLATTETLRAPFI